MPDSAHSPFSGVASAWTAVGSAPVPGSVIANAPVIVPSATAPRKR